MGPVNWKECFSEWLILQHRVVITPNDPGTFKSGFSFPPQTAPVYEEKTTALLVVFIILVIIIVFVVLIVMRLMHLVVPELTIEAILCDQILV